MLWLSEWTLIKLLLILSFLAVASSAMAADFSGDWEILSVGNHGEMTLEQDGNTITGTIIYPGQSQTDIDGTVDGEGINFTRTENSVEKNNYIGHKDDGNDDIMLGVMPSVNLTLIFSVLSEKIVLRNNNQCRLIINIIQG